MPVDRLEANERATEVRGFLMEVMGTGDVSDEKVLRLVGHVDALERAVPPHPVEHYREQPAARIAVEQNSRGFNVSARLYGDDLDELGDEVVEAVFATQRKLRERQAEEEGDPT